MGPRVLRIALLAASAVVTVAIFALAPITIPSVLASFNDRPHSCGGG
jgi:hypothetical protein